MRRVVVTGLGVVSPLGCDLDTVTKRLQAGYNGVGPITRFDVSNYDVRIGAQVTDFDCDQYLSKKEQRRMDRYCHYAIVAARKAVADAGLNIEQEDTTRIGVVVGSGIGGLQTLEEQHSVLIEKGPARVSPFMIPLMIANMASGLVAIDLKARGPNYAVVSACATAAHGLGDCMRMIQYGDADVMIAGGAEASITTLGISGFASMKALSTRNDDPKHASRPFDAQRDGFVMGEGGAILVLEDLERARRRGAPIYCELAGFGMTCDAYHMTAPSDSGEGGARAMVLAMKDAKVSPDEVTYINAHGTSTPLNDKIETLAIKTALGEAAARKTMISSTKSMTGHLLGAAGGMESIVCALAIKHGFVPPTINYEYPDPDCDLDYVPNEARTADVRVCLNNSLGFGGHNACLCFRKLDA